MATAIIPNEKPGRILSEFEFVQDPKDKSARLGKGSFASVKLAREKKTSTLYALKMINVNPIKISRSDMHNLQTEIQIHRQLSHPNIIKFHDYIQEGLNVYLVLDYAQNGTLYTHLHKQKVLTPNEVFHFFHQTCLAIQYLHQNDILHRDLKPENLLLDKDHNIKLCDFGWAARNINNKRVTFCGTYEYMAPEIVKKKPYDYRVDIWSLGVLLYELVHREAPYKGRSLIEIINSQAKTAISFSPSIQPEVKDLIQKMLKIDPSQRISLAEILSHPWIKYHLDKKDYIRSMKNSISLEVLTPSPRPQPQSQEILAGNSSPRFGLPVTSPKNIPKIHIPAADVSSLTETPDTAALPDPQYQSPEAKTKRQDNQPKSAIQFGTAQQKLAAETSDFDSVLKAGLETFYSNKGHSLSSSTLPKCITEKFAFEARKFSNGDVGSRKLFEKDIMSPDFRSKLNSIIGQFALSSPKSGSTTDLSPLENRSLNQEKPKPMNQFNQLISRINEKSLSPDQSLLSQSNENFHNLPSPSMLSPKTKTNLNFNNENFRSPRGAAVENNSNYSTLRLDNLTPRAEPMQIQTPTSPTFKINFGSKIKAETTKSSYQKYFIFESHNVPRTGDIRAHRINNANNNNNTSIENSMIKKSRIDEKNTSVYFPGYSNSNSAMKKTHIKIFEGSISSKPGLTPLVERSLYKNRENKMGDATSRDNRPQVFYENLRSHR